jgi:peptide/nickel transport system substrate-binding protein
LEKGDYMKRRPVSWRIGALSSVVALVVVVLGAGAAQSAPGAPSATTLVDGTTDSITNIDPAGSYDYGTFTLESNVFDHLLDFRHGSKLEPSLATKCFSVGSLTTWRCTLRRGVTFSDGSAFDSADVKFSFDRVTNKTVVKEAAANTPSSLLGNLKSVTTNGKYAVTFRLKAPQVTWPSILASQVGFIVPSDTYEANHLRGNTESQIGTGPYKLTKYSPGQQAVYTRNDSYWGTPAKTDNLIIRYYSKSSTMKLAIQRGEIDMSYQSFTPTEITSLQKQKGLRVYNGAGGRIRYLTMNVTRPPANNVAVRRAVAYLMPRQTIASRVYHGQVKPLYSMVPAGYPGHIDAFASLYGRSPNPAKAKQVLQAAGLDLPVAIEIWWTPTHYGDASADEYAEIKRSLERNGVFNVTLKSSEWAQYSSVLGNQYNIYQLGWFPDYPDAENYLVPFYRNDTFTADGYNSPKMEALIKKELGSKTLAQRIRVLKQIQLLAAKDVPIVPYWQQSMIAVGRNNVRGIPATLDPTVILRFWQLSKS